MFEELRIAYAGHRVTSLEAGYKHREEILEPFNEALTTLADLRAAPVPAGKQERRKRLRRIREYERYAEDRRTHLLHSRRTYEKLAAATQRRDALVA